MIAFGLIKSGKASATLRKGMPSASPQKKKMRCQIPHSSIQLDKIDHWLLIVEKRNKYKFKNCTR